MTIDIVLAEVGDVRRFKNAKQVAAYAGLTPRVRKSADRRKDGGITKEGSGLLRWARSPNGLAPDRQDSTLGPGL